MSNIISRRYLRRREAAAYLGLAQSTLAVMASENRGPAYSRVGRVTVYDVADLDRWVAERRRTSPRDLLGSGDGGSPAPAR